jgi:hypothetical protein
MFYLSCAPFVALDTVVYNKTEALFPLLNISQTIPVATRSMAWFCGRVLAVTAGSKPAEVMDICERCVCLGSGLYGGTIPHP